MGGLQDEKQRVDGRNKCGGHGTGCESENKINEKRNMVMVIILR